MISNGTDDNQGRQRNPQEVEAQARDGVLELGVWV